LYTKKEKKGKKKFNKNREAKAGRPRFKKKRRICKFCMEKGSGLNYQDPEAVQRYITDRGKIAPRRISGCCAKHQRMVAKVIKRARQAGLAPYALD
jgi:small subunit ribosomal protein S18